MVTVVLQHDVQDFDKWKSLFDADHARRQSAGVRSHTVGRLAGKPNTAVVVTQWDNLESFQKFVQDPKMQEAMQTAGVVGAPTVQVLEGAESVSY